jgi:hypothetical protein
MSTDIIQQYAVQALGYPNYSAFYNATGLSISTNYYSLRIQNDKDRFYASLTAASQIFLCTVPPGTDPFLNTENLLELKRKVKAKLRQHRELEEIKQLGIEIIKQFMSDTFEQPKELLQTDDIEFTNYSQFKVAGIEFKSLLR